MRVENCDLVRLRSILLLGAILLTKPLAAGAEDGAAAPHAHSVVVEVRSVEASEPAPQDRQSPYDISSVDARLDDIRTKLQKLHYRKFRLVGVRSQVVPLLQKGVLELVNGHSLTVRPLYISPRRIGLWLKWLDKAGIEVLDTRLHFDPGESMLTGTDGEGEKGMVLAIDVKPAA